MQELKTKHFGFIMSPRECHALQRLSEQAGLSRAALLRRLLRTEARRRSLWTSEGVAQCSR